MKKMTDDEIMAKALKCPESEKVPLEVGDRVIALETFSFWNWIVDVPSGARGCVTDIDPDAQYFQVRIRWDSHHEHNLWGRLGPIGKLVKREGK